MAIRQILADTAARSPWLTRAEAAAYAKVHPDTLDVARRRGTINASRAGGNGRYRYHRTDLDRWLGGGRLRALTGGAA
jgi:excisionase family DNA binding protein